MLHTHFEAVEKTIIDQMVSIRETYEQVSGTDESDFDSEQRASYEKSVAPLRAALAALRSGYYR